MRRLLIDFLYVLVASGAILIAAYGLAAALYNPPPLKYTQSSYAPASAVVEPGGTLVYTPTLKIAKDGPVRVVRSFWNLDTNTSAQLCDGSAAPISDRTTNIPATLSGTQRANQVRVSVPKLPKGHYWLLSSAIGTTGAVTSYSVGFEVTRACD